MNDVCRRSLLGAPAAVSDVTASGRGLEHNGPRLKMEKGASMTRRLIVRYRPLAKTTHDHRLEYSAVN